MRTLAFAIAAVAAVAATHANSAPSAEEVRQLGGTLTQWGAEIAGSKDGAIPSYAGGLTRPPPSYDKTKPGWRPDPFAEDKPLFSIDAKNVEKYGDKVSEGVKAMMLKYPTFRIDVYPTRRSVAFPKEVVEETVKNATRCALLANGEGLDTSKGCRGGFPFPIPKTAQEVMWNKNARYWGSAIKFQWAQSYVKPNGERVLSSNMNVYEEAGLYNDAKPDWYYLLRTEVQGPTRVVGQTTFLYDRVNDGERRAWSYQPATRRVRLAPDFASDTPIATLGGAMLMDEPLQFSGKMDRFDFKLLGKKEMFIPYNAYKLHYPAKGSGCRADEKLLTPHHLNPDCVRWELHRVWHVQGTLKPGARHVFSKRDIYIDEDAWFGGLQEGFDASGKVYHVSIDAIAPMYDVPAPGRSAPTVFDLSTGIYTVATASDLGYIVVAPLKASDLTPDSMSNHFLRY